MRAASSIGGSTAPRTYSGGGYDLDDPGPYGLRGLLKFLQHVPDRGRAEQAFERVGRLLFDRDMVALDPDAEGEVHTPLDFAPNPDSIARRLFDEATIEAHLDHLAGRSEEHTSELQS